MMTRARPRGGSARLALWRSYGRRHQRDVMAITETRFRPPTGRDQFRRAYSQTLWRLRPHDLRSEDQGPV